MTLDLTGFDMFCGAGGSSTGFVAAGGRLLGAANHWALAIETHNTNHPSVDHYLANISLSDPRNYPKTDVLIASPECVNHSSAKRKAQRTLWDPDDPKYAAEERSRATMFDVVRFTYQHRYQLVIVENVVEARNWELFESWIGNMTALGYEHRAVYLNSMIAHPTPQSRDRMYVVFWLRGNPAPDLEFRPTSWCPSCARDVEAIQSWKNPLRPWGKYRSQYVYRCPTCAQVALPYAWPAAAAIDWGLPAPRIGDRDRPLADATIRRIRAGLERYGSAAIIQAAGHTYERAGYYRTWPTWQPLGTQTTTIQHGLVVETGYSGGQGHDAEPSAHPFGAQTARASRGLVVSMREGDASRVLPAEDGPIGTQVGTSSTHGLVVTMRGTSDAAIEATAQPPSSPLGPVTANGPHHALVVPLRTHGQAIPSEVAPVPTIVAGNAGHALLIRNYTARGNPAQMASPIEAPTGSVTTVDHHALLVDYHGAGKPGRSVDEPHRTMDSRDRYGLVAPAIEIEDCGFRMLEPHEIKRAMGFADDYVILGTKREQVRQEGNAVTPPTMTAIVERGLASLRGGRAA